MASPHPIVKRFDRNTFKSDCEKLNDADEPELFLFSDCSGAKITFTFYSIRLETSDSDHHFLIVGLVARAGLCSRHTLPLEISIWLWARVLATCAGCTSPSEAFRTPPPPHMNTPLYHKQLLSRESASVPLSNPLNLTLHKRFLNVTLSST